MAFFLTFNKRTFPLQKMKFSIKDFLSKFDQIRSFLRIWLSLLKKSLMENFIFYAVTFLEALCMAYIKAATKN